MGVFDSRVAFKPYEYPWAAEFKERIQDSFWTVREMSFDSDVDDFKVRLTAVERQAVTRAMLAISQVEVAVKEFWAKLGDRFPKAEFKQVGITFGECFADGTEILTPTGWVDLKDIGVGDDVLQFHGDNTFTITTVKHKTDQEYTGDLHRFHKRTTEVLVTPNHRMVHYDRHGHFTETKADQLKVTNTGLRLPESGRLVGGTAESLTFIDRLRIAIQADGNRRSFVRNGVRKLREGNGRGAEYEVRIQKERKVQRLDWILANTAGVDFSKRPIPSRPGMFCYTIRIDADHDYKSFDWVSLHGKTAAWCEDFVQELAEWDGVRLPQKKDCQVKFGTTNRAVADVAQMVGVGAGYRTHIGVHVDKRKESYKDMHVVSFTRNRDRVTLPPLKREVIQYSGMVRCVTVESGAIITRWNGQTFISGNSEVRHADAYSELLTVLGLNEDFAALLDVPAIQGRVSYLAKYLSLGDTPERHTLVLTLFSLFVENVSLFAQFAVIKSVFKHRALLKNIDNVVQATQLEEQLHALFGARLVNTIRAENPGWFHEGFAGAVEVACRKAYAAESNIVDWIYEGGELPYLPAATLKEFLKDRFNQSLALIGGEPAFAVDRAALEPMRWFDEELLARINPDFFNKRPVTYSRFGEPITADELF